MRVHQLIRHGPGGAGVRPAIPEITGTVRDLPARPGAPWQTGLTPSPGIRPLMFARVLLQLSSNRNLR
jgi:hypothetical protein